MPNRGVCVLRKLSHEATVEFEDPFPDSDTFHLQRHVQDNVEVEEDDLNTDQTRVRPEIFRRISSFMSRNPLLSRSSPSQGSGSYGLVPNFSSIEEVLEADAIRESDGKKGKSSALGSTSSTGSSQSKRHRQGYSPVPKDRAKGQYQESGTLEDPSHSKRERNGHLQTISDDEYDTPEDETIDIDGSNSKWTDENPHDNSA